jgi:hypothetical protein
MMWGRQARRWRDWTIPAATQTIHASLLVTWKLQLGVFLLLTPNQNQNLHEFKNDSSRMVTLLRMEETGNSQQGACSVGCQTGQGTEYQVDTVDDSKKGHWGSLRCSSLLAPPRHLEGSDCRRDTSACLSISRPLVLTPLTMTSQTSHTASPPFQSNIHNVRFTNQHSNGPLT